MNKVSNNSLKLIKIDRSFDERGFFSETYNKKDFNSNGISVEFVQDNHSMSVNAGTIRGMHFQNPPNAQAKLVRCIRGAIYDVALDIRKGSPTYGFWEAYELSASNNYQLYIPIGFAHGFQTLVPDTEIVYKCSDFYAPNNEGSLAWNDKDLLIDWPIKENIFINQKDKDAIFLENFNSPFIYEVNS